MSEYSVELKGLNKVYSNLLKEDTVALKRCQVADEHRKDVLES